MKHARIDVAGLRRTQIVEAAVAVITEQGLQNLSLSEIEKRAGMSRGQLTYYFPTKEAILLAVFDHLVMLMHLRIGTPEGKPCYHEDVHGAWVWIQHLLKAMLVQPPISPEFSCLQYTFLAQIGHREDFRERLAMLYEMWRKGTADGLVEDRKRNPGLRPVPPREMASFFQALMHGLGTQLAADPDAFDREEMLNLCLDVLSNYLGQPAPARKERRRAAKKMAASNENSVQGPLDKQLLGRRAAKKLTTSNGVAKPAPARAPKRLRGRRP